MVKVKQRLFSQEEIESISQSLGDTDDGLTGTEIGFLLTQSNVEDVDPNNTKWKRLYNALVANQNEKQNRTHILEFIRQALKPQKFLSAPKRFNTLRNNLNKALWFAGIEVNEEGKIVACEKVCTLSEASKRADKLRESLIKRDTHPEVLKYCKSELLHENYFHAVLEAVKSIFARIRDFIDIDEDGSSLIDKVFTGDTPLLKINDYGTKTEKQEQAGFANLLKGIYGMFRNPLAHQAKIYWPIESQDAEDLMTVVSMVHRRLDKAFKI